LPPIFPIVLYNGDRAWTAPVNIADLIQPKNLLGKYALDFEYYKIAVNEYSQDSLLKIRNIVSTLFLAESHYDIEQLEKELLALFENEGDKQAISLFLNWFKQLAIHGRMESADYFALEKVYRSTQEVGMLLTSLREERERLINQGISQGIEQGISQGQREEKYNMAERMLNENIDISLIVKVTGLAESEILQLKKEQKNQGSN